MVNTLTLNPAIDKVLYLPAFQKNVTNRIQRITDTIGGKGTHVSINLKILGLCSRAFGVAHGNIGLKIIEMLHQYQLDVRFLHIPTSESRINYLMVEDNNDSTLIAEKGVQLTQDDLRALMDVLCAQIEPNDYLVLAGDASNCSDPMIYNRILRALEDKKLRIFLDTSGETLAKCVEASPFLIKPNLDELSTLCSRPISCNEDDVVSAIDSLERFKISVVAVSLGNEGSVVRFDHEIYKAVPPAVRVSNTVGCGDSFMSGLVYGFSKEMPIEKILRLSTAMSAATAESPLSVGFDYNRAMELADCVQIHRIR